jgi:hypothetical protein
MSRESESMVTREENGLTLEGLAQRLEALERENERMRSENAELRSQVATLEGPETPPQKKEDDKPQLELENSRVSRRQLLSKVGAAAAGLVVAGALTQRDIREAKAAQVMGDSNEQFRGGVEGTNNAIWGYGVMGRATDGWGVDGQADRAGVRGSSTKGSGVEGHGPTGIHGFGQVQNGTGVLGQCSDGFGVQGKGMNGVYGESSTPDGWAGVVGRNNASAGIGTFGEGTNGIGVQGIGKTGVHGKSTGGWGGLFEGSQAQLRLVPKAATGKPTGAHTKGEIYMDSAGTLFICVASSTSTAAAKWKKVSAVAV